MKLSLFIFLILHVLTCALCAFLTGLRILKSTYIDVFILFFNPVFGLASLLIHSRSCRNEQRQAKELELAQAQIVDRKATERVQNTIRAGQARPDESGASSQASTVTTVDWKHATPEQLKAQAKRIRLAAAQGRKLRPGE